MVTCFETRRRHVTAKEQERSKESLSQPPVAQPQQQKQQQVTPFCTFLVPPLPTTFSSQQSQTQAEASAATLGKYEKLYFVISVLQNYCGSLGVMATNS
ncbi:hypothetical protein TNCV_1606031 [Trichonephila clavipes]|nr:hypothetical protein TNCV_1606031 [Trichonephila clavipes]